MNNLDNIKYFIFSCGKTGSSSIEKSLKLKFGSNNVLRVHSDNQFKTYYKKNENIKDIIINNSKKLDKIYIIDSYREPFERSISSFFQNIDIHLPKWENFSVDEIITFFNEKKMFYLDMYQSYYESWGYFDLSIDIEFDFDKGYVLKEKDNMVFVKTRLNESYRWSQIFSEIIGEQIDFIYDNNSEKKPYSKLYKEFKEKYKLPDDIKKNFLRIFNNPDDHKNEPFYLSISEMKKFMTKIEIEDYLDKWIN